MTSPNTPTEHRTDRLAHPGHAVLAVTALVHASVLTTASRLRSRADAGQTTAEYALVLLAAAAVAMLVMTWATKTKSVGKLLDGVIDQVVGRIL